ncbi:YbdD/YjiX family protein [Corynebacterium bovis]|uniref:YbdD/YjiX family protein n=1 Tax=Corynebacterium bovis TaxID=36808 RepID=UPI003080771D
MGRVPRGGGCAGGDGCGCVGRGVGGCVGGRGCRGGAAVTPRTARTGRTAGTARAVVTAVADYARGVLGADRYRRYLDHHARQGCGHPPLSEKEYWRSYYAHQEDNPGARCC